MQPNRTRDPRCQHGSTNSADWQASSQAAAQTVRSLRGFGNDRRTRSQKGGKEVKKLVALLLLTLAGGWYVMKVTGELVAGPYADQQTCNQIAYEYARHDSTGKTMRYCRYF
jgi:hypothetical protein